MNLIEKKIEPVNVLNQPKAKVRRKPSLSILIRIAWLIVEMSKGRECSSSEPIELVSENLDLLCLLLGDVQEFTLVSDFFDLFAGVSLVVAHRIGFETHDLHTLLHLLLELAGAGLQLLRLGALLSYFFLELLLCLVDGLDPLFSILFDALGLLFETFLVFFVFLLVLALDYFLGLLSDSVKLHIFGSFFVVLDLQIETLLLIFDLLEIGFEVADILHQVNLVSSSDSNFLVLVIDNRLCNQNCIFVVCCNRQLRHFNLSLLHVNNRFEVIPNLVDSISSFLLPEDLSLILLLNILKLISEIVDVVLKLGDLLSKSFLILFHFSSAKPLLDKSFKVFRRKTCHIVSLIVIVFLLFFLLENFFDSSFVYSTEGIQVNNSFR